MNRTRLAVAALAAGAFAAVALGQNAGNNSAGPTKNDYRLRVVEPAEGGTISGRTVRVVVNTEIPAEAGETRRDVNSMPRPDVDVFLDNQLKGTFRDAENVLQIEGVGLGAHKLVLLAKNRAGEIIDRKEVQFSNIDAEPAIATVGTVGHAPAKPPASAESSSRMTHSAPVSEVHASEVPPSPARSTSSAQAPAASARPSSEPVATRHKTLPKTASSDPSFALAGAVLLLAGLFIRRLV